MTEVGNTFLPVIVKNAKFHVMLWCDHSGIWHSIFEIIINDRIIIMGRSQQIQKKVRNRHGQFHFQAEAVYAFLKRVCTYYKWSFW